MASCTFLLCLISFACVFAASLAEPCRCGSVEVAYPFWMDDGGNTGAAYFGYPSLRLECRRDTPVLRLPSGEYGVAQILYGDRTLNIFDLAVTSSSCPHELAGRNLTLPPGSPPPLSLTSRDNNLTIFLSCSFVGIADSYRVPCLTNTYVFRDDILPYQYAELCQEVVGMPVLNPTWDVVPALKGGLELTWAAAAGGQCAKCEHAGGMCGYQDTAEGSSKFICFNRSAAPAPAPWIAPSGNKDSDVLKIALPIMGTFVILAFLYAVWIYTSIGAALRRIDVQIARGTPMDVLNISPPSDLI